MELALQIQADTDQPLHQQVYEQIRLAILTGRVRSHQRLPASRQLARSLGLSRTTIVQSYEQLISEGYLETRRGAGTFVCARIPDEMLQAAGEWGARGVEGSSGKGSSDFRLSSYGQRIQKTTDQIHAEGCELSFQYGVPAMDLFPVQQWRRLQGRHATTGTGWMDYSRKPMGYEPLQEQIAQYVSQTRAVRCEPEQVLVTSGTQQALSLIVRLLIDSGDAIAIENPGYLSARRIFISSGATILPVPVDSEGLEIDGPEGLWALSARSSHKLTSNKLASHKLTLKQPSPKLVYVTPSHQFPTGVLMSLSRQLALLQWAQQTNGLIIEDDYDSEFRYSGRPVPALQGLDGDNRVLYVGTFSKVMFPGLRLGYIVLPQALIPVFRRAKWLNDRQSSLIDQQALTDFISEGHLAKHVRRMRSIYEGRRRSLVEGLGQIAADPLNRIERIEIPGDESGLHIMAHLPTQHSNDRIIALTKLRGVSLVSAHPHYWQTVESPQPNRQLGQGKFIFGFGNISERHIRAACDRIKPILVTTEGLQPPP